ncbi:MAG: YbhB/YbcL family Raf kinase inhibitor-like protein, partial [Flavobacterium sp.]
PEHHSDVEIVGHIFKPVELPAPNISQLKVPAGFKISKFAENLGNARIISISPAGNVYVTRRETGDVLMIKDNGGDKAASKPVKVISRSGLHGITFYNGKVYLATVHEIYEAKVLADGTFGPLKMLIHDLPDAGQHNTRTVQIGPDNMMYIGIGSTCNECTEPNQENATILRGTLDGKSRAVFASGLRDPIGWGWHPQTGELWGMDHGIDWLGDDNQPEELNKIENGKRYGWPYIYADNKINPRVDPPGGLQKSDWIKSSVPMVMGYDAHSAPMQMSFYNSTQFPKEYQGDAFVSLRGSWNRKTPKGYEVVRVRFKNGQAISIQPFVTGFVTATGEHGRLCGNAIAKDGSLLFSDDRNGVIYKVKYTGKDARSQTTKVPATAMIKQTSVGDNVPIAIKRITAKNKLTLHSSAFENSGVIPDIYSEYEQGASFPLSWKGAPANTKSFVLIMEDPDVKKKPKPVIHWTAWNIPATVTSLRQGLQKQDRLEDPKGLMQGLNSNGIIGYRGPRPPAGDPFHHYHTQVFALDTMLNLNAGADREKILQAMKGHVLASGDLVGLFRRPDKPSRP